MSDDLSDELEKRKSQQDLKEKSERDFQLT